MYLNNENTKRLGIFFVYDKDGIIDEYIIYLLKSLRNSMTKILAVCNGLLSEEGREKLSQVTDDILLRENVGFDGWAYKSGIEHIGWDKLSDYDEIVMFNHTIMGPVNSFDEMFEYMNKQDLDFWGITKYHQIDEDPFGGCEYGYLPEHIQSHFICVRKNMFESKEFHDYWDRFPKITSYFEAINKHEAIFTKKFADKGFKWSVYVDTSDLDDMNKYPLMFMPLELVKNRKCPIFKRRMFFHDYSDILNHSVGNIARDFWKYLEISGKYDVNMIWDNILRTYYQEDIVRCLNLRYILSSSLSDIKRVETIVKHRKIALVMHLYFDDLFEEMCQYASNMPESADIYITTNTEEKKNKIEEIFRSKLKYNLIDVRVIENRGRDVSSILVGVKDVVYNYDYICFAHDKKTTQLKPGTVGSGFANKCFENTLRSDSFVNNVLCLFEDNPRLGILSPPGPNHATFFGTFGDEWGPNFEVTKKLAEKLGITIPMSNKKMAIAPYGTLFWFRPNALKKLYDYDWKYEDFPEEPNNVDGTILHAVERIYPIAAQQMGYYPAIVMSDYYAENECTNLEYYARTFNQKVSDIFGRNYHSDLLNMLAENKDFIKGRDELLKEYHTIKGEKFELELKTLKTMEYINELHKRTKLSYNVKSIIKRVIRKVFRIK